MKNKDFGFLKKPTTKDRQTFTLISDGSSVYAIQGQVSKTFHDSLGIEFALELPAVFFKALSMKAAMDMRFELLDSGDLRLSFPAHPELQFDVTATPALIEKPAETDDDTTEALNLSKQDIVFLSSSLGKKFYNAVYFTENGVFTTEGRIMGRINVEHTIRGFYDTDFLSQKSDYKIKEVSGELVCAGQNTIVCKKSTEGYCPNFMKIIPTERKMTFTITPKEFLDALYKVKKSLDPETNKVSLSIREGGIALIANHPVYGFGVTEIPNDTCNFSYNIALEYKYIVAALKGIKSDVPCTITINSFDKPIMIEQRFYTVILMTMKDGSFKPMDYKIEKAAETKPCTTPTPKVPKKKKVDWTQTTKAARAYLETGELPANKVEFTPPKKEFVAINIRNGKAYTKEVSTKLREHASFCGYDNPEYGTYNQWKLQNRCVKKGERGCRVDAGTYSFTVFNIEQTMEV